MLNFYFTYGIYMIFSLYQTTKELINFIIFVKIKNYIMSTNLLRRTLFSFRTITPQDYLMNQRESGLTKTPHVKTLYPLEKNNHG
mgnify:FL=1